ncbi:MAG: SLBB domain-containing protein [Proteobacteria bacterium]|nr:SLBB domain-containing protein [Pseudomonadota bacterium]
MTASVKLSVATLALAAVLLLVSPGKAIDAQTLQPTAEQLRMLNQLPPAQREQALEALRSAQGSQAQPVAEPTESLSPALSPVVAAKPVGEVQRAGRGSRLIIDFSPKESLSEQELEALQEDRALARLRGSQNFVLDDQGVLSLLGIESIPLLGLTENDIERRLGAEALLTGFDIDARILESEPTGAEALKPFGYDIFEPNEASFDPPMTGPVPPDYVLGPGDTVRVQLFGNVNGIYEFAVTRDGILNLPEIGPVTVAGLPFSEFRADVNRRVQEMLIGTQVSVTMGELRTIRIFVLGDVNRPGSYVVDSLATISSALYRSGGISRVGSLRYIQLKRSGQVVARLDLYDLLLRGDTSGDSRLQPGDVIFVPAIGPQVSVAGAVNRPAIYETLGKASVSDIITMAGGLQPDAYPDGARIERIEAGEQRIVVSIDADSQEGRAAALKAGDLLLIPRVLPDFEDVVTLTGHVHRPGPYQWRSGMRLNDLIESALELKPGADTGYILIRREDPRNRTVSVVSANLGAALANPASPANIALQPRDTAHVFSMVFGRQRVIEPILEELQLQSRFGEPYGEVSISGNVKAPGTFPFETGMRVDDLIRAGGGLAEQAYSLHAEVARYAVVNNEYRSSEVIDIDLDAVLRGDDAANLVLQEHDNLRISRVPDWDALTTVRLEGEIKFPGDYRVRKGETLREVLERAGGLTDEAFPEGAIFLREELREREQDQIDLLAQRLEADLTSLSLEESQTTGAETLSMGKTLLAQLRATEAVGRLVIDLEDIAHGGDNRDLIGAIELREGDRLLVPKGSQAVTVIGQTQQNASHLHRPGLTQQDYIELSGGLTRRADKKLIYVVRASGAIVANNRSSWLGRGKGTEIRPGDTIVVPLEIDRIRPLELWTSVTQILYQAAIAVTAVDSFGG